MPDFEKLNQQVMLARALFFLPAPGRGPVAEGLYDLGVRVHPELATKEIQTSGPPGLVNHSPRRLVEIKSQQECMEFIRKFKPELAARIAAAKTPADKRAVMADIRAKHPELIAEAQRKAEAMAQGES